MPVAILCSPLRRSVIIPCGDRLAAQLAGRGAGENQLPQGLGSITITS